MAQRQCLICAASVDENKAFCPECGAPMDQENRRESLPEISGMTKTFNIGADEYQEMLRDIKVPVIPPPKADLPFHQTVVIAPETTREVLPVQPITNQPEKKKSRTLLYVLVGLGFLLVAVLFVAVVLFVVYKQYLL